MVESTTEVTRPKTNKRMEVAKDTAGAKVVAAPEALAEQGTSEENRLPVTKMSGAVPKDDRTSSPCRC